MRWDFFNIHKLQMYLVIFQWIFFKSVKIWQNYGHDSAAQLFLVSPVYHSESQRVSCITTAAHASADIEQNAAIVSRAPTNAAKRSTVQILSFFRDFRFNPLSPYSHTYYYSITHSLFHSRLKSFLFCKSSLPQPFIFLLQDSLYGFPRLFTVTSEHIRFYFTF